MKREEEEEEEEAPEVTTPAAMKASHKVLGMLLGL